MKQKKQIFKRIALPAIASLVFVTVFAVAGINLYITSTQQRNFVGAYNADKYEYDCILVLGCGVRDDGTPSHMLEDRLKTAIMLYNNGIAPKLIMSGDHGRVEYDEVNVMKQYAIAQGVPSSDIFMDHAGFSTYDSLYRARDVFNVERVLIVTQEYHLYRALHIADSLGLEAHGTVADLREYAGQTGRDIREAAARVKDFFSCIIKPEPKYLGEVIPVSGDGDLTNDK